jgi:hypothetical protein
MVKRLFLVMSQVVSETKKGLLVLRWRTAVLFFAVFFQVSFCRSLLAEQTVESLKEGDVHRVSESRQWRALIHYRQDLFGSLESTIDSASFFLAFDGRYSPWEELKATLEAFLDEGEAGREARCHFAARYLFLQRAFPELRFPEKNECSDFAEWYDALAVESVSLVFIDSFLNNPASLFGHNLLRLNAKKGSSLLSYAVQYSAAVESSDPGFLYALKGMFGGYQGFYSLAPYYVSVSKYSEAELRDIWEYPLDLSFDEIDILLRHLWELQGISADYYYFDDNCSALLAELLEAAAPRFTGLRGDAWWNVPIDLLQQFAGESGLLKKPTYRPSRAKKMTWRYASLSPEQREEGEAVAFGERKAETVLREEEGAESKSEVLSYAHDLLLLKGINNPDLNFSILTALSSLPPHNSSSPVYTVPDAPHTAHFSRRLTHAVGYDKRRGGFYEFGFRPAYHALTDPSEGLGQGSQIEVLPISGRFFGDEQKFRLARFDLLDIISLAPTVGGQRKFSWALNLSRQQGSLGREQGHVGRVDLAMGKAWSFGESNIIYILGGGRGEGEIFAGGDLAAAPLIKSGLVATLPFDTKLVLSHNTIYEDEMSFVTELTLARKLSSVWNSRLSYSDNRKSEDNTKTVILAFDYYF